MAETTTLSTPCTAIRFPIVGPFGCDHRPYPHAVQFYLSENFLLSILSDFIVGALKGGDGAVVVATQAHRDGLMKRLCLRGLDPADLQRTGRYVELDAMETLAEFMVRGVPKFERFSEVISRAIMGAKDASEAADPRVMVFGELVAVLLARRQLEFALLVEQFWGRLANAGPFSLLCAYPIQEFEAAGTEISFLRICAQHLTVSPPEAYASAESEDRILRATARSYVDASLAEKLRSLSLTD